jgi:hypothetical protein
MTDLAFYRSLNGLCHCPLSLRFFHAQKSKQALFVVPSFYQRLETGA